MSIFDSFKNLSSISEIKGNIGEQLAKYYSKTIPGALVLNDVLIEGVKGNTSQIDLLIVGSKGIYVIEVKNFQDAKIYGDGKKIGWYYYRGGKKYEIYSPIFQNRKHIEYLKTFLNPFGNIPCFSIITILCDDFKVSNINKDNSCQTAVCNSLPAMEKGLFYISENKPIVFDRKKQKEIYDYILKNQLYGKQVRKEHKENVKKYNSSLDESKQKGECPFCKVDLVLRQGRYGEFYGCPNYPKCNYTLKVK